MRKLKACLGLVLAMLIMMAAPLTVSALEPFDNFYVNDYVGILSDETVSDLASRGRTLREENGVQVVTVIVNNYIGDSMESYANEVFNDFGIGSKEDNNGVLLIVAIDDGEVRIEVGDGLSGLIPDSKAGSIMDDYFIPSAKEGNFEKAIRDTYVELIRVSSRLATKGAANTYHSQYENKTAGGAVTERNQNSSHDTNPVSLFFGFLILVFVFVLFIQLKRMRPNYRRNNRNYYNNPNVFYPPPPPPPPPSHQGGGFWGSSNSDNDDNPPGGGFRGGGHSSGGGGVSSGGGAGRNFGSGFSGGGRSFGGGHSSGGGGRSSGGGAGRKF